MRRKLQIRNKKGAPGPLKPSFERFLVEVGRRNEIREHAVKAVFAWQLDEVRKAKGLSKSNSRNCLVPAAHNWIVCLILAMKA